MFGLRCANCTSPSKCPRQKAYKQTTNRLRVAAGEEQIVIVLNSMRVRFSRSHFNVINSSRFYVCFMLHDLYRCARCHLHVFMGVHESPWSGRPPPQQLHPWSTGCVLQAWPRGSRRSGCTECRPSAGAPGIHQPPGPQGVLEEKHTQIHKCANPLDHSCKRALIQTNLHMCIHTHKIPSNISLIGEREFLQP